MLRRVRKSLRRDEVRGHLDRLLETRVRRYVEVDRNRGTVRERLQRRAETALGQDRRMDPTRDLLQIFDRSHKSCSDARQLRAEVVPLGGKVGLRRAQRQSERDKPLLRSVVQVALD